MAEDHIEARSITLRDSKGNPRITMDAGGDDGFATITLISNTNQRIVLSAQPTTGDVIISFDRLPQIGTLSIHSLGITLRAPDGRLGVIMGLIEGTERILVYENGQVAFEAPLSTSNPEPRT